MTPVEKIKQLMAELVALPSTPNKLDLAVAACSEGKFNSVQDVSNAIIADIQSYNNSKKFLWECCNIDLENDDVGSIIGLDASHGTSLDKYDVIPEVGSIDSLPGVGIETPIYINGLEIRFSMPTVLDDSSKFIMKCMASWWIKNPLDIIEYAYGLKFTSTSFTNKMPIDLSAIPPSGGAITMAYVVTTYNVATGNATAISCVVNTHPAAYGDMDTTDPNGKANSVAGSLVFLDRTLAHEMTHAVMSANISGFGAVLPKWFIEGSAELIIGADDTRKAELLATANSVTMFQEGLNDNTVDTLRWYTTGYIWLRWFIKHTSILLLDLSFEHPLPDIEIYEYKVSDNVAFEWGRANNCKFNLVNDELIDFVLRSHSGLSKWDLCTSKEYLHSGYGATVRVPYNDAVNSEDIDYINLSSIGRYDVCVAFMERFLSTDPCDVFGYIIGPAISYKSDTKSVLISLLNHNKLFCPQDIDQANYNSSRGYSFQPYTFTQQAYSTNRVINIVLTGHFTLFNYFSTLFGGSTLNDATIAITQIANDLLKFCSRLRIYDFSGFDFNDARDTSKGNSDYLSMMQLSSDDTALISFIHNNKLIASVIEYTDCKERVIATFPNINDFRTKAIVNTNPVLVPVSVNLNNCYSQYFCNLVWDYVNIDVDFKFNPAEYTLTSLSGIYSFGIPILYTGICDSGRYGGPNFSGNPYFEQIPPVNLFGRSTGSPPNWGAEVKPSIENFASNLVSYNKINGKVMIIGLECVNVWYQSVTLIMDFLERIKDIIKNDSNNDICVGFIPPPIYSEYVYKCYTEIKASCLASGIPVVLDKYVCMKSNSIADYLDFADIIYGYDPSVITGTYAHATEEMSSGQYKEWARKDYCGLDYFYFYIPTEKFIPSEEHMALYKTPCYYISFTDLPFSDMIVPDKEIAIQAIDGVAGDVLSVNLHTIYDPLSPAYYQGGGVCKPVYDFVVDPATNKTITGLINHHNDGANVPNVDANYSYPVYGTGCPWIVYPDDMKELYDVIYFYFTRNDFTGTITYQLSSSHDDSVKPIYQTIVYGSTDTDNYTSKYPLYVGGGLIPFSPTQYTYIYQPPKPPGASKAPPAVPVTVMGNKYNFDLTTTMSSNTLPLYPIHPQDSKLSNFALKCEDGEWKFISSFDSHNVESTTEDFPCLYTLSDTMRWGVMLPYVGSDFYNMYVYDKYLNNMRQLKPLRVLNPNMTLKEELGFGAITVPLLWASHTDNVHGLRTLTASNYESKSILDIAFMQSVADGDVINIHGNYDAYTGGVTFNSSLGPYGVGPGSLVFTDPFDEFDRIEVIFTEDSGTNRYVASWTKAELYEAVFGSRDLDFDITRGSVHPLYWKINKSGCNKIVFYGLDENCGIIDIVGYKKRSFRYLVVPNGYLKREFNMFAYSNDKDNTLDYKQQFALYNEIINSYRLNNDLYIYVGS